MENVRIQDDLFLYVNQEKLEQLVIPEDRPTAGGFAELHENVEKLMMNEFKTLEKEEDIKDENLRKAVDLYSIARNVKKRNSQGIKPIMKDLTVIRSTADMTLLNRRLYTFVLNSYPLPFNFGVDVDMKDSNKHCIMLSGPRTILPDTTMYKDENQKKKLLDIWSGIASQVLSHTDLTEEERQQYLNDTLEFDAIIATLVKSSEEWSEYTKCYNPYTTNKVNRLLKPFKFKNCLKKIFGYVPEEIIVADPRFLKGFNTLFNEETYEKYIHWSYMWFLFSNGAYLSEELRDLCGAFRRTLSGIAKPTEPVKFAYQLAS